ncbi:dihydroorotase [Ahrensia marina]|uniref:Dihydroorotase n=1 Tax=Ahrensia marina TaxID=1514904 RepID=A0A0M9GN31_9HYPH|nr:dihydroorotase [Ahrensia marina]KPB01660.1 dihydroorotase [Ahrensia marina]
MSVTVSKGTQVYTNGRIVDPSRGIDEVGAVIVEDGVIAAAGADAHNQGAPEGADVYDLRGMTVIPGLVDMRVHIGEPGGEHRETIASASEAAAAGGVTSLVMMPDTNPVIDDVQLVEFIRRTALETAITRILPSAAITKGLDGVEMTEMGILRNAGAVMFTDGRQTIANAAIMRRAMTYARDFGALISHTTQDADLAGNGVMNEGLFASWLGLSGIPREAELLPLERDLRLARLTGCAYHAAKISCAMSADAMRVAKSEGLNVTAGISINHLALNENDIGEYRTFFKLSPPLRSEDDRQAMVSALADGTIDVIISDHDPQDVDTKRLPFAEAADGAVGLESLLAAGLRLVNANQITLATLIAAMSTNPAKRLGLEAGTLGKGAAADFAIVDLDEPWLLKTSDLKSKSKNTSFEDARLTGRVQKTFVAGTCVYSI